ncbi:hypothetical protein BM526_19300 (plasmid) [Alteromonas mediterranea]|nr:hypothetical protein BM526_19300 [Alteromonas mediterranea]
MTIYLFRKALDNMNYSDKALLKNNEVEQRFPFQNRDGHMCYLEKRSKGDRKRNPRWRRQ